MEWRVVVGAEASSEPCDATELASGERDEQGGWRVREFAHERVHCAPSDKAPNSLSICLRRAILKLEI